MKTFEELEAKDLKKIADDNKLEYPANATKEKMLALLNEKGIKPVEDAPDNEKPEDSKPVDTTTPTPEITQPTVTKVESVRRINGPVTVVLPNGQGRTYTQGSHGKNYRVFAQQYADNKNGTVVEGGI